MKKYLFRSIIVVENTKWNAGGRNDVTFTSESEGGNVYVQDVPLEKYDSMATGTPSDLTTKDYSIYRIKFDASCTLKKLVITFREEANYGNC